MGKSTMMRVLAVVALCIAVTAVAYDEADDMISPLSEALEVGETDFKGGEKKAAAATENAKAAEAKSEAVTAGAGKALAKVKKEKKETAKEDKKKEKEAEEKEKKTKAAAEKTKE